MNAELIFLLTVFLGSSLVMTLARLREGTWLSAATLYSFGWLSVVFCYKYADLVSADGFVVPESSFEFAAKIVAGGYVGVFLAHIFFKGAHGNYLRMKHNFIHLGSFLDRYYLFVCAVIFMFGLVALIDRFSQVGFSIFSLQDLRSLHVHSRVSLPQRLAIMGTLLLSMLVGLSAIDDALRGRVNSRRVIVIIIALFPLALSKGSRQEFLNPVIIYFVYAFIVMRARSVDIGRVHFAYLWRIFGKFVPLLLGLFVLFTVYGELRTIASKEAGGRYEVFSIAEAPLRVSAKVTSWLASSLYSLGPIASYEDSTFPRMHGRFLLEPIYKVPEKLRLIPETGAIIYLAKQDAFEHFKHGIIAFTPGTMGKVLTREVGMKWAPYLAVVTLFILTAVSTRLKPDSILKVGIVFLFSWQILMTFQTIQGLNMAVAWRIFFVFLIGLAYRRYLKAARIIT